MTWTTIDSPIGGLRLVVHDGSLTAIEYEPFQPAPQRAPGERDDTDPLLEETARQLKAYFAGQLSAFDLPLAPVGTEFQQRVWQALRTIGFGATATYGQVAALLGLVPGASRAVGMANGRNPIPIVIPCHRVVGANGTLTGYAGGLERKQLLLDLERPRQDALF